MLAPDDHRRPTSPTSIVVDGIGGVCLGRWEVSTDDIAEQRFIRDDLHVGGEVRTVLGGKLVNRHFASWNQTLGWLRALSALRHAA